MALEGRTRGDYTLGKNFNRQQVEEISQIALKHGFRLSGFRSFERPVRDEEIDRIRSYAGVHF